MQARRVMSFPDLLYEKLKRSFGMSFLRELESFKTEKLNSVQTTVTTAEGRKVRSKFKRVLSFVNKIYELLCYNSLKFIEHKSDDGGVLAVDTGERFLGFCEDLTPDDKVYKVQDKIFISSQDGAQNMEELKQNSVTHILNVGTGIENAFPKEFDYKTVELLDLPETHICHHFPDMFDFIQHGFKSGAVLVHCNAGVSRSAAVILGYLMSTNRLQLEEAMEILREARPCAKPNEGFLRQLQDYQKQLDL